MFEQGKEIANTVRIVRKMLTYLWEEEYYELQVGDLTLIAEDRHIVCEDTILCVHGDRGAYWILPPRDTIPPALNGFLHIVNIRGVWNGVEMYPISGHEIGKCGDRCIHVLTLANCHTHDMRQRMALELDEGGEDE